MCQFGEGSVVAGRRDNSNLLRRAYTTVVCRSAGSRATATCWLYTIEVTAVIKQTGIRTRRDKAHSVRHAGLG